jgi:hypothetical protein
MADVSNVLNLQAVLQPLLETAGIVVSGFVATYLPRAIVAFEKHTNIQLTDQQRDVLLGAVQTAKGIIETKLDQGVMQVAHVTITNEAVLAEARAAIAAVPDAAAKLGVTEDGVARMIVGAVETGFHATVSAPVPAPVVPVVDPATPVAPTPVATPIVPVVPVTPIANPGTV